MQQGILPFAFKQSYNLYDFIVAYCNFEAYLAVTKSKGWSNNRLIILGEKGSGKSHLAHIWQKRNNAIYITSDIDIYQIEQGYRLPLIIDNVEDFKDEHLLFHIINIATEYSIPLLMTAGTYFKYQLPDLRSRLNATNKILIKTPDCEIISMLLIKLFNDRQLYLNKEIAEYISVRIKRSFSYISILVEHIDKISLERKKSITIPFVKTIMHDLQLEQEEQNE